MKLKHKYIPPKNIIIFTLILSFVGVFFQNCSNEFKTFNTEKKVQLDQNNSNYTTDLEPELTQDSKQKCDPFYIFDSTENACRLDPEVASAVTD